MLMSQGHLIFIELLLKIAARYLFFFRQWPRLTGQDLTMVAESGK